MNSFLSCKVTILPQWHGTKTTRGRPVLPQFLILSKVDDLQEINKRRSAHYHPSIWDLKHIESLSTPYTYGTHGTQLEKLKKEAKRLITSSGDHRTTLKLIDLMERLGVDYHFEEEIMEILGSSLIHHLDFPKDLYSTALRFRLLRKHGYPVSSDVFEEFRDGEGRFMHCLSHDLESILSLHEASYLATQEDNLEEAKKFSTKHLKSLVGTLNASALAKQVQQLLEIPSHWRMHRVEARNFIDAYERDDRKNLVLLKLAMLDYNVLQSVYQREVKELARWWRDLGFKDKLRFSRDRLMENYLWAVGISYKPQFSKCRVGLTKFICILTAIDDMYDVYGSLEELERFTDAVNRWDSKALEQLPEYMKLCYLALFNFGNEMAYVALRDHGLSILPAIKDEWANLCRSYLVEARWFYKGYRPTTAEYLANAWVSVGGPAAMFHAYILQDCTKTEDLDNVFKQASALIYWASLIGRLCDDLGTSEAEMRRGDTAKSIQCYMSEEGLSEKDARERVKDQVELSWKRLNEESGRTSLPRSLIDMSVNMARAAHCIFRHGDGIGTSHGYTRDVLISLIIEPIQ
uniref:Terpene synthase 3 n=1 Tax=Santalum album TaxID=35974 RepID=A0A678XUJ0_SANAL|nr:terpene synthase 3 [Santalum album]